MANIIKKDRIGLYLSPMTKRKCQYIAQLNYEMSTSQYILSLVKQGIHRYEKGFGEITLEDLEKFEKMASEEGMD